MTTKDLIPMNTRPPEVAKAMRAKGGRSKSPRKQQAILIKSFEQKKCKNCTLPCPMKEGNIKKNPDHLCSIPAGQRMFLEGYEDPKKLDQYLFYAALGLTKEAHSIDGSFDWKERAFKASAKVKELVDPPTQNIINLSEQQANFLEITYRTISSQKQWKSPELLKAIKEALEQHEQPKKILQ